MGKELEGLEKALRRKYTTIHSGQPLKQFQIRKLQAMIAYTGTGWKKFTSILNRQAIEMNRYLQETDKSDRGLKERPPWSQKTPKKGITPNNYRPITCLPIMWKILMA